MPPFHLAFPVTDLEATRRFYADLIGCQIGRQAPGQWIDFDFFGHQITAHLRASHQGVLSVSVVDRDEVPVPHFGAILPIADWRALAARLEADPDIRWGLKPKTRFAGEVGEQSTLFLYDPSGNALEFKAFGEAASIFAT
ncbi:VOC family protein [soil metagenome]